MEITQQPIDRRIRFMLRAVYTAGFLGTGYALYELLTAGGMNAASAAGITVLVELFAVTSSTYSTRARLRGESGFVIRNIMALGTLTVAALQCAFHWHDSRVQALVLPLAAVLALILWVLDVNDRHARVFHAQRVDRKYRRKAYLKVAAFVYANGIKATHSQWKERTVSVGTAERAVRQSLELGALDDALSADAIESVSPVTVPIIATVEPLPAKPPTFNPWVADVSPVQRNRGAAGRPLSPAPADTVVGVDEHARLMRGCRTATDAARYAWTVFGADASPTDLTKWLAGYGVTLSRAAVSVQRPKVQIGA